MPSSPMPTMDSQRGAAAVSGATTSGRDMRRILILGGTTEARALAGALGRARRSRGDAVARRPHRASGARSRCRCAVGGFGGAEGLANYLVKERIDALIDATHPYAAIMAANAAQAAGLSGVPFLALRRPPWSAVAGDRWSEVADARAAMQALGEAPRRVFLALGRNDIAPFVQAPQHHYLVRSVDPVEPPLRVPHARYVIGARSVQGGRRSGAARGASHRDGGRARTAAAKPLTARSRPPARSASTSSCCAGRRCRKFRSQRRSRTCWPGSIMRGAPGAEREV